jgi:hypothetical protein
VTFDAGAIQARLELDRTPFQNELREALAQAKGQNVTVGLDADDAKAKEKIKSTGAAADELGRKRETIKVDADTAAANAKLRETKREAGGIGTAFSKIPFMITGITALLPGAITLTGVLAGAASSVVGAYAAGGIAVAAYGAVAKGIFSDVKTATDKVKAAQLALTKATTDKQRQAALEQQRKALASLAPAELALYEATKKLHHEWHGTVRDLSPAVWQSLRPFLDSARIGMGLLKAIVEPTSAAIGSVGADLKLLVQSPLASQFSKFIGTVGSNVVDAGGHFLVNFLRTIMALLPKFTPFIDSAANAIRRWGVQMAAWAQGSGSTHSIQNFLQWVRDNKNTVLSFMHNLVGAIKAIAAGAGAGGGVELRALSDMLRVVAALPPGVVAPLIDLFTAFAIAAKIPGGSKLLDRIGGVAGKGAATVATKGVSSLAGSAAGMAVGGFAASSIASLKILGQTAFATAGHLIAVGAAAGIAGIKAGIMATATGIATAAQWAWNAAMLVADTVGLPVEVVIGAIVLAVAGLAFGIYELVKHWRTVWGWIKGITASVWTWIKEHWPLLLGILTGPIGLATLFVVRHWHQIWNGIQDVWHWIRDHWKAILGFLTSPIALATAFISGRWHQIWNATSDLLGKIRHGWNVMWDNVVNAARSGVRLIGGIINGIKAAFRIPVAFVVNQVWDRLAGIWNRIAGVVGLNSLKLPIVHMAEGGIVPGQGRGDKIPALLEPKERVLSIAQVAMLGGHRAIDAMVGRGGGGPFHFAGGGIPGAGVPQGGIHTGLPTNPTGMGFNPLSFLGSLGKKVLGWLSLPLKALEHKAFSVIFGLLDKIPGGGFIEKVLSTLITDVLDKLTGDMKTSPGGQAAKFRGKFGSGVAQWAADVARVLGMLGLPSAYLPLVLYQMQTESGGNPNAINLTDSNAAAGDPSRGLMQTIMSTFLAYNTGPFAGRSIYDPLANIYAALNYAMHNGRGFGTGVGQIGSGHGYRLGGRITEPILGIGASGRSYQFGEAGNEWVTPDNMLGGQKYDPQIDRLIAAVERGPYHFAQVLGDILNGITRSAVQNELYGTN